MLTNTNWLQGANPFAAFAQTVEIDGVTLDLGGTLDASDIFVGFDNAFASDGTALTGGVHVRQISGVLNIGIADSDTGNNTVISVVTGTRRVTVPRSRPTGDERSHADRPDGRKSAAGDARRNGPADHHG